MKVAFSVWNDRISPVFDASLYFLVLDIENGEIAAKSEKTFNNQNPFHKVTMLSDMQIQALVCGAISRPLVEIAAAQGIKVFPFIAGNLEEVIESYFAGTLSDPALAMPGCCGRRGRFHGEHYRQQGNTDLNQLQFRGNQGRFIMPRKDGTGPDGKGSRTGRGSGRCGGQNKQTPGDKLGKRRTTNPATDQRGKGGGGRKNNNN